MVERNYERAQAMAFQAEETLRKVVEMGNALDGFTPALAVQIAQAQIAIAAFWQAQPDTGDRAAVA